MAAIASLFAIFKAGEPFYLMDGGAGARRREPGAVPEALQQLSGTSQVIIVTHQKRTMELADVLYDMSMSSGTTKVVAQRLVTDDRSRPRRPTSQ
jgi:chromosome segregation protein